MVVDIDRDSRTPEGRDNILEQICISANSNSRNVQIDKTCWDLYNNKFDGSEFDYLRKVGDKVLPAKVRHTPKQRPYCEYLTARQIDRAFQFSVSATDEAALKHKMEAKASYYGKLYTEKFTGVYNQVATQIQQINDQKAQLEQELQTQPQTQEEYDRQQQLRQTLPQIENQIQGVLDALNNTQIFNERNIREAEKLARYTNKDFIEEIAQKAMKAYIQRLSIKLKSVQNFINHIVVGKEYYYVNYTPGDKDITYRSIPAHTVFYQATNNIEWVHQLDWAGFEEWMNPHAILDEWGHKMSVDQQNDIKSQEMTLISSTDGYFVATEDGKAVDLGSMNVSTGTGNMQSGISVKRCWWTAERVIKAYQKSDPKIPGKFHTHFVDDNTNIVDKKDFYFHQPSGSWVNREDPSKKFLSNNTKYIDSRNNDTIHIRYAYDRFFGVIINNSIRISGMDEIQPRGIDNMSTVPLPIIGPTFNNFVNQPYSLILATKDIQASYNIVNFHKELMLAVSGTKSLLMDTLQKPDGMSDAEWRQRVKTGFIDIQTRKKGAANIPTSFNQFQVIDMSLSSSIQYFDNILENLDNQIGLIMGVTRQAMGQVVNTDQVGTFQLSQQSTLLITEVIYAKHDEIERQALTMMINLARQYLWDKDTLLSFRNEDNEEEIIQIPAGLLDMHDYNIIIDRNTFEERKLTEMKNFAMQNYAKGQISLPNFLTLYNIESTKEMIKASEYFAEQATKLQQDASSANADQMMQIEEKKMQLKTEMEMTLKKQEDQISAFHAKLAEQNQNFMQQIQQRELGLKEKELDARTQEALANIQLKDKDISLRNQVEMSKLEVTEKHNNFVRKLDAISQRLSMMQDHANNRLRERELTFKNQKPFMS